MKFFIINFFQFGKEIFIMKNDVVIANYNQSGCSDFNLNSFNKILFAAGQ